MMSTLTIHELAKVEPASEVLLQPRASVLVMPEYHPPLSGRDALRLDFNENTFAPSPTVLKKLHSITAEALTTYPERAPVERIVAEHLGLQPDQLILTNGVDEAIHLIACAFLDADDEALLFTPGFFMYDVSIALMAPGGLRKVQAGPSLAFDLDRFLAAITPRTKLIIVASPNNPTGATVPREHAPQNRRRRPASRPSWSTKPTSTSTAKPPSPTLPPHPTCSSAAPSRRPTAWPTCASA